MWKTGGYWDDGRDSNREHCYSIAPMINEKPGFVGDGIWEEVYQTLGKLGYRFRDSGYDSEHIVVSLNKPIGLGHLRKLRASYSILTTDGAELGFV